MSKIKDSKGKMITCVGRTKIKDNTIKSQYIKGAPRKNVKYAKTSF